MKATSTCSCTSTRDSDWGFRATSGLETELDAFEQAVGQFKTGVISEAQFRAIRVPRGVYEQRESGTYMLRVRFPAGGVQPDHLRCLGEASTRWGNGLLHVTTRQEFQIHRVPLDSILPALRSLAGAGLSTKGGGGNTVRNITACLESGVCPRQVFDVTPHAIAATERFMADPLSLQLPRKFKIAFAACEQDCSGATVHDVGFVARNLDGRQGFAVYVAGGMGGKSRVASLLHDFIPEEEVYLVAEAVKRVFDKNGDRRNKHLARLRFLLERMGMETFRSLYDQELAALSATNPEPLRVRPVPGTSRTRGNPAPNRACSGPADAGYDQWLETNVEGQAQPGFHTVHIPLDLGDLPATATDALAGVLERFGDGILWATQSQNLHLRWITPGELPELHRELNALGLAKPDAPILRDLVACAGASTCRLGICLSRGLAKAIRGELLNSDLDLDSMGEFPIHISGCPNSCGRHPVGSIGFSGAARRVDGRMVPYYAVQLGGRLGEGQTRFGANIGAVPARNAPAFVSDLLRAWSASTPLEASDFHRFIDDGGRSMAAEILARHQAVPEFAHSREHYYDWDANALFSLAGRGAGECSAGVFDLIEVDLANARESLEAGRLYAAALSAARALLITKGLQPKTDAESFELFQKHFVAAGLVEISLEPTIAAGALSAAGPTPERGFPCQPSEVTVLVAAVRLLFESMDASLRFPTAPAASKA